MSEDPISFAIFRDGSMQAEFFTGCEQVSYRPHFKTREDAELFLARRRALSDGDYTIGEVSTTIRADDERSAILDKINATLDHLTARVDSDERMNNESRRRAQETDRARAQSARDILAALRSEFLPDWV